MSDASQSAAGSLSPLHCLKLLQTLLNCAALAILLVVIVVVIGLTPNFQTWGMQKLLSGQHAARGSVDSVSAGFGRVEIANLKLDYEGASLNLPLLQASLPITRSAMSRSIRIRDLVATGWTLNLSHWHAPAGADSQPEQAPGGGPGPAVTAALAGLLANWQLPCEATVDGVDLEGDVLVAAPPETVPARLHVVIRGGGIGTGPEGRFDFDLVDSDPRLPVDAVSAHGNLIVSMDGPRTIRSLGFKAALSTSGGALPETIALAVAGSVSREPDALVYKVELTRGSASVAGLAARLPNSTKRPAGTWSVDILDSDLTPFFAGSPLPSFEAAGGGSFDADPGMVRIHAAGHLHAKASRLGALSPALAVLGSVDLDSRFDVTRSGSTLRFASARVSMGGDRPVLVIQALQPFELDQGAGRLTPSNPLGDWMAVSASGFPLSKVPGIPSMIALKSGKATGSFVVQPAAGGFSVHADGPLMATGVTALWNGRTLLQGADLVAAANVISSAQGWEAKCAPLVASGNGRKLVTLTARVSLPAGPDKQLAVSGTWNADPSAIASGETIPGLGWLRGRSASGDFSGTVGSWAELDCRLALAGTTPGESITANAHADVGTDGTVSFYVPLKVASGADVSDLTAEGTWASDTAGTRIDAKLNGGTFSLAHLRLLAAAAAGAGGGTRPATAGPGADRVAFWGTGSGRVDCSLDHLRAGDRDFGEVTGQVDFGRTFFQIKNGRGVLPPHNLARLEGEISFDPAAVRPYGLAASAEVSDFDAAKLFSGSQFGKDPALEGHFSIAATFSGTGTSLEDLAANAREEYRLRSTGGIARLLKTSVAGVIPQAPTKVSDTLGGVGAAVGSFFGAEKSADKVGRNPVSPNAEAVLNFTYAAAEIGYDEITVTAVRGVDRGFQLTDLTLTSPELRLTGSGRIGYGAGVPLTDRPLSLDLSIGARGDTADLLSKAGLLSSGKDSLGYSMLAQPVVHFGGSLGNFDSSQWHDLLAQAALRKPDSGKKTP